MLGCSRNLFILAISNRASLRPCVRLSFTVNRTLMSFNECSLRVEMTPLKVPATKYQLKLLKMLQSDVPCNSLFLIVNMLYDALSLLHCSFVSGSLADRASGNQLCNFILSTHISIPRHLFVSKKHCRRSSVVILSQCCFSSSLNTPFLFILCPLPSIFTLVQSSEVIEHWLSIIDHACPTGWIACTEQRPILFQLLLQAS